MRILLVRHGESQANVDKSLYLTVPDHEIALSSRGKLQAQTAGNELVRFFEETFKGEPERIRVWNSPYRRTRETATEVSKAFSTKDKWHVDYKEHLLLHEQKFGLFDGIPDDQLAIKYPEEYAHYKKHEDFQGKFWARIPLGESRADVVQRVHQSFGTFHRDFQRYGIENLVIATHGTLIRSFVIAWLNLPWENMENEKNPNNCSIRLIENGKDKGYIFNGYKDGKIV